METLSTQAIPEWMIFIAGKLTPHHHREIIKGDLLALRCPSRREYASCAASWIGGVIRSQMQDAFNIWLLIGEALFVCLPVYMLDAGVAVLPFVVFLMLLLLALRLRDAYAYPASGSASEMILDAASALSLLIGIETAFAVAAPRFALPFRPILLAAAGSVMVACWRMIFRREDPPDPIRHQLKERCLAVWHMNALVVVASVPLVLTNVQAVPGSHGRDQMLGGLPLLLITAAWRLKKEQWQGTNHRPFPSLFRDPGVDDMSHQIAILPVRDKSSKFPSDVVAEALYFFILGLPALLAAWRWVSGDPSAAHVDWPQVAINFGAVLLLAALWIKVKKMNSKLAEDLRETIRKSGAKTA